MCDRLIQKFCHSELRILARVERKRTRPGESCDENKRAEGESGSVPV